MAIDPQQLRTCLGYFATGVTIVSCTVDGVPPWRDRERFHRRLLDPPLVLVSLGLGSKAARLLPGRPFTVNVLSEEQHDLALRFAGKRCAARKVIVAGH